MLDNQIGIHVYRIRQHQTRKPATVPLSSSGPGAQLRSAVDTFITRFSNPVDVDTGHARPWYFEPKAVEGYSVHGLIQYGSSGYESDIVDRRTREHRFKRETTDMDVIPLYYRFWIPESGDCALISLQTFGLRSCVNRVQAALEAHYRSSYDGFRITFSAVLPTELGSIKNGVVKTITLVKRDYSSDLAMNQLGIPSTLVDYNVSLTAKKRENLGAVRSLLDKFSSTPKGDGLDFLDQHFDEAQAYVKYGSRRRKVTLLGIGRETGKIDLSDDVTRMPSGHPRFDSIASEVKDVFSDIVTGGAS